jgi:hypothetical protein
MKTITYLILGMTLLSFNLSEAQVQLDTIYIRKKAVPTTFVEVRYYYYPNLEAYFDTKIAMYIFKKDGQWTKSETIDTSYRGYSIKNGAYVMLKNFTEDEPYAYIEEHKRTYPADYSSRPKPKAKTQAPANTSIASLDL